MTKLNPWILIASLTISGCQTGSRYFDTEIPNFDFPETVDFSPNLSDYELFEGSLNNLTPSSNVQELELSSALFTDYAYKFRTVKLQETSQITPKDDEHLEFPDGTILTKTFYYYNDERSPELGKNIVETRLLIKKDGIWNAATYVWNETQTDASLLETGLTKSLSWMSADGEEMSTDYAVPSSNDCLTCHQRNATITPLGPTIRNLNRQVLRGSQSTNQLQYLQSQGMLSSFLIDEQISIVNYMNAEASLETRARAYLALNCAHCHQPGGWEEATERHFDFRYTTGIRDSGIRYSEEKISNALQSGEMPFIGTTMIDHEGTGIVLEYLSTIRNR